MPKTSHHSTEAKLDVVILLLQNLLALELAKSGVPHSEIGKRIKVSKAGVGALLRGVKKQAKL